MKLLSSLVLVAVTVMAMGASASRSNTGNLEREMCNLSCTGCKEADQREPFPKCDECHENSEYTGPKIVAKHLPDPQGNLKCYITIAASAGFAEIARHERAGSTKSFSSWVQVPLDKLPEEARGLALTKLGMEIGKMSKPQRKQLFKELEKLLGKLTEVERNEVPGQLGDAFKYLYRFSSQGQTATTKQLEMVFGKLKPAEQELVRSGLPPAVQNLVPKQTTNT